MFSFAFLDQLRQSLFDPASPARAADPRALRPAGARAPQAPGAATAESGERHEAGPPVDLFGVVDGSAEAASVSAGASPDAKPGGPNEKIPTSEAEAALDRVLALAPSVANKNDEENHQERHSSPADLEAALTVEAEAKIKKGFSRAAVERTVKNRLENADYAFPDNEGQAKVIDDRGTDPAQKVKSRQIDTGDPSSPIVKVETDEQVIMKIPPGADPKLVSTDFAACGATVVRGVDKEGNMVILLSHVLNADLKGHGVRIDEDVKAMHERELTDIQVVVVPGESEVSQPKAQPELEAELQEKYGDIKVTTIDRKKQKDEFAHVLVDKEGVRVYEGDLKLDDEGKRKTEVTSQTHRFSDAPATATATAAATGQAQGDEPSGESNSAPKSFSDHLDDGARPYLEGMEKALGKTPEGEKVLAKLASKAGAGIQITTERGVGSFRDGNRINIDPDAAGDSWRKMASELVEQVNIDTQIEGDTPEERAAAAARNAAEARVARIEHNLDEGFGPDKSLTGSREYEAAVEAALAAGATEAEARAAGVNAVSEILRVLAPPQGAEDVERQALG